MKTIRFSHKYSKLYMNFGTKIESAVLMDVLPVKLEQLSDEFKAYDTDNGRYPLPKKGEFLMLLFKHINMNQIFPTLRRFTPEKARYYKQSIGEEFKVEVNET